MKKLLSLLLWGLLLFGCGKEYDDTEIKNRLDNLENARIPSIESQIAAIQTSLPLLQQIDTEIKGYIVTLQGKVNTLEQSISQANAKIVSLEYSLQPDYVLQLTEIVSQLNSYKQDIQNTINSFNSTIGSLKTANMELEKKISYLDGKIDMQRHWVTATFTTLTQYNGLVADIATIRINIENINKNITDLETRLNEKIETDIATAVAGLQEEIRQKVTEITEAYTTVIGTAKDEITTAYTTAISSAITDCIASIKDWVHEKLANYYNIAAIDAKVQLLQNVISDGDKKLDEAIKQCESTLKAAIEQGDEALAESIKKHVADLQTEITTNKETLQKEINETNAALETAKTELTEAYTTAIATAIETNNGIINKKIADEITAVNNRIATDVSTLSDKISTIETRLNTLEQEINDKISDLNDRVRNLETKITDLLKRIQSVSYIPRYNDGQVVMKKIIDQDEGIAEFDFMISPKNAVSELEKVWNDAVTMKAIYTQTRAVSFVDLPVLDFIADIPNGIITLKVSGEKLSDSFFLSNTATRAALFISDGNNSIVSDYIPMVADVYSTYTITYTTNTGEIINDPETNDSSIFWEKVIVNTYSNGQGKLIFIDNDLPSISTSAFYGAYRRTSLTSITLPEGVTSIGSLAFYFCEKLTSITIPDSVISIEEQAFCQCHGLSSITLPEGVTSIGYFAFSNCSNLVSIYCKPTIPPNIDSTVFALGSSSKKIYVPTTSLYTYQTATDWSIYKDRIVGYKF